MTDPSVRHLTLIAYDSPSAARRRRLSSALSARGRRIQKSVFFLWLSEFERRQVHDALMRVASQADSIVVLPVCARCQGLARRHNAELPEARHGWLIA